MTRLSTIVYRHEITGARRTETAEVVEIGDRFVLLRSRRGWPYVRPIEDIESIDGEPLP